MEDFKITLEAARVNAGLTQQQAADTLGVNVSTIINWETGKTKKIPVTGLAKLCKLYSIPQELIFLP